MLEHRTPLDSIRERQAQHGPTIERRDFHVAPANEKGLLMLQSASVSSLQKALSQVLDLTLPAAQQVNVLGNYALLWLGPAEWLIEVPRDETDAVEGAPTQCMAPSLTVITDFSDALVSFEVSGSGAPETLMTGCSLDMRSHAFPARRVVRTALAGVPAILWNPGNPDRFRCLLDRGFAGHFLIWLEGTTPVLG
jgi:heterotetrameric sarcosine oxidase gamma subunit